MYIQPDKRCVCLSVCLSLFFNLCVVSSKREIEKVDRRADTQPEDREMLRFVLFFVSYLLHSELSFSFFSSFDFSEKQESLRGGEVYGDVRCTYTVTITVF